MVLEEDNGSCYSLLRETALDSTLKLKNPIFLNHLSF